MVKLRLLGCPRGGIGAIQTFGEHKGSGLGLACELLAGALTGSGTNAHERPFCNGMLSIVFDPAKFDQDNGMRQEIEDFCHFDQKFSTSPSGSDCAYAW